MEIEAVCIELLAACSSLNYVTFVNFDRSKAFTVGPNVDEGAVFTYVVDLDSEIHIQGRIVNGMLAVFGELGGLKDAFELAIAFCIGSFPAKSLIYDQLSTFFRKTSDTE